MSALLVCGQPGQLHGRYLVCGESVAAGQMVLREEAMMTGPRLSSVLVCVECLQRMGGLDMCNRCGLPLCNSCQSQLEEAKSTHTAECLLLHENGVKFSPRSVSEAKLLLSAVTVLRLLLRDGWRELEGHSVLRRNGSQWRFVEKHVVSYLGQLRDKNENILFSQELIHQAAGVLDTNCFELKTVTKSGSVGSLGRCLFLQAALFNNSCEPNCRRRMVNSTIEVTTVRAVSAGEQLTICYADLLQPTHIRQDIFWQTKLFLCQCGRCRDPAERGSYMTSVRCGECGGAVLQHQCKLCGKIVTQEEQLQVHDECEHLLKTTDWSDCQTIQNVTQVMRTVLTTHHHLLVECKQRILQHAGLCRHCRHSPVYACSAQEIVMLRDILLPGSGGLDWGEWGPLK